MAAGQATAVAPLNAGVDVGRITDLSWTAGSGAVSHDVYFGTAASPPQVSTDQTATTFDTGTMAYNTTYNWKINEKNACGTITTGTIWSFTTITDCLPIGKVFAVACGTGPVVNLTVAAAHRTRWENLNNPKCWCCDGQKCGNGIYTGGSANRVDGVDLTSVSTSYGLSGGAAGYVKCVDFNLSNRVDGQDLTVLSLHYGKTVGSTGCTGP